MARESNLLMVLVYKDFQPVLNVILNALRIHLLDSKRGYRTYRQFNRKELWSVFGNQSG